MNANAVVAAGAIAGTAVAHHSREKNYTVRPGDTLSGIAGTYCGNPGDYPSLASASHIANPNVIDPGEAVRLACHAAVAVAAAAVQHHHRHYRGEVGPGGKVWDVTYGYPNKCGDGDGDGWDESCAKLFPQHEAAPVQADPAPQPAHVVVSGTLGMSGFEACVIRAESGGNQYAQNPTSTASGLFGFLDTTWTAVTGLPGPARDYSVGQQEAAFQKEYAEAGTSPWGPYDGC